jgi:hypothetical protein
MIVRSVVTLALVSFLAIAWCFWAFVAPVGDDLPSTSRRTNSAAAIGSYKEIRERVEKTIDFVDESTDRWYQTCSMHLRSLRTGQDLRMKVSAAMHREEKTSARWKSELRSMDNGNCSREQAARTTKRIDVEADDLLAEQQALTKEMQQIPGCHCGN